MCIDLNLFVFHYISDSYLCALNNGQPIINSNNEFEIISFKKQGKKHAFKPRLEDNVQQGNGNREIQNVRGILFGGFTGKGGGELKTF